MEQQGLWERAERLRGAADEAARLVHNFYISFLLLGTYIAVIIGSTTDVQLLKSSSVTLPLLNVPLPIVGFYAVVPWLLLLFHFNLLLQLTLLAQKLHRFNAVLAAFTDDAAREEQCARLFPFPFSAMLIGRHVRWRLRWLLGLMIWTTIILLPLGLLLWAQLRFLPYHNTAITWIHRVAVLVDLGLLWWLWPLMLIPEHRGESAAQTITQWREEQRVAQRNTRTRRLRWRSEISCLTLVTVVFSLGIAVLPEECMEGLIASIVPKSWRHVDPDRASHAVFMPTYWLFEQPGAFFPRNLRLQEQVLVAGEPSAKVIAALRSDDETKRTQALEEVTGLILTNRDLRGADFRDTLFPKGDLRGANLQGASLERARIFAVNLSPFSLSQGGRCVSAAQLRGEEGENPLRGIGKFSCYTNLQGADLLLARLQGANLFGTRLQGADLQVTQLQGTSLWGAHLQAASLNDAHLEAANLLMAQLQGANLGGAHLEGANLAGADLKGANLSGARIGSADFTRANLTLSSLLSLSRSPLDEKTYNELAKSLTHVISDKDRRADVLKQMRAAVGRPAQLQAALSPDQVLCDDVDLFPACLTKEKMPDYDHARASFLGELACTDVAIARRVATGLLHWVKVFPDSARAFAKSFTAIPEKDCPGRADLPGDQKDSLRKLAAGEPLAP